MAQDGSKITPAQQRAIDALVSGQSLTDAAKSARVGRRTLTRWRSEDDDFLAALADAQAAVYATTINRIVSASTLAIRTLAEIAKSSKASDAARVSASVAILNHAHQSYRTVELEHRLDQLERLLDESD